MTGLIVIGAILAAATLALLLPPLLRRSADAGRRVDFDLAVYKDQLAEIERDVERGLLSAEQAAATRTEVQRRILAAADSDAAEDVQAAPAPAAGRKGLAAILGVAMPLGAFALYMALGSPGTPDYPFDKRGLSSQAADEGAAAGQAGDLAQMVGRLAERLLKEPDNLDGWLMLGRSYMVMQRPDDAANAYPRPCASPPGGPTSPPTSARPSSSPTRARCRPRPWRCSAPPPAPIPAAPRGASTWAWDWPSGGT